VCRTAGLAWQFVLAIGLVGYEQRSLRWSKLRDAMWLRAPRSPKSGRVGGRLWLIVIPLIVGFAAEDMVPDAGVVAGRDFMTVLDSAAGHTLLQGSWVWCAVLFAMLVLNTVIGEELLFRGVLLPRMNGAFGRWDWVMNGVLFGAYHLHIPWVIPAALLDTFFISYPAKRYQSAWIGIIVHSAQSVVIAAVVLTIIL
jgi:membrane protease YdiL (CAAX protease family)